MSDSGRLDAFRSMLAAGQDGPLLRYSLGLEALKAGEATEAADHLVECLNQDPSYSAAYKALARARYALADEAGCRATLELGMTTAGEQGDEQARKEMGVLVTRLDKGKPLETG